MFAWELDGRHSCCRSSLRDVGRPFINQDATERKQMTPAQIVTREFVIDDYESAAALWQAAEGVEISEGDSKEEIARYLQRNPGLSRVAEEAGAMAGAVLCGHDGRRGFIYHLAVAQMFHGRGMAKLLLADCINGLRAAGMKRAIILVAGDNPNGHEFWLRNGWEDIAEAMPMARDI
jgi:putative acetyltransferase